MTDEGAELLQVALLRCFRIPSETGSLRTVMEAGLESAVEALSEFDQKYVDEFYANDEMFTDRTAFEVALPRDVMARRLTELKVKNARTIAYAATLVFTHAAVDAVAFDCCRAITLLDPNRCTHWIEGRSFKMGEILSTPTDVLLRQALDARLSALDRESLMEKTDFIYRVCRPEAGWGRITGYTFDRERLERVDSIRHDVAHKPGPIAIESLREGDEKFLEQTALHLVLLAAITFGIKFDPNLLLQQARRGAG